MWRMAFYFQSLLNHLWLFKHVFNKLIDLIDSCELYFLMQIFIYIHFHFLFSFFTTNYVSRPKNKIFQFF